jgi:hypothetical protein
MRVKENAVFIQSGCALRTKHLTWGVGVLQDLAGLSHGGDLYVCLVGDMQLELGRPRAEGLHCWLKGTTRRVSVCTTGCDVGTSF